MTSFIEAFQEKGLNFPLLPRFFLTPAGRTKYYNE